MSEQIYDEQIAPLLKQAADICTRHGLSLAAACEYAPGDTGLTFTGPVDKSTTGATMYLADLAVRARGNVDALMLAVMRHATETGHSSMILSMLGVAEKPVAKEPTP